MEHPTNVDALWQRVRELQAALDALKEEIQDVVDDIEAGPRLRANERENLEDLIVALRGELAVARGEVELEDADIAELEAMAGMSIQHVMCIANEGNAASLTLRRVYKVIPDEKAARRKMIRTIDDTGEDYLFSASCFAPVQLLDKADSSAARLWEEFWKEWAARLDELTGEEGRGDE